MPHNPDTLKVGEEATVHELKCWRRQESDLMRLAERALIDKAEAFDSNGDPIEHWDWIAQVVLEAAYPAILKDLRERLLGDEAVEAAGEVPSAFVGSASICKTAAREVIEAALDSIGGGE